GALLAVVVVHPWTRTSIARAFRAGRDGVAGAVAERRERRAAGAAADADVTAAADASVAADTDADGDDGQRDAWLAHEPPGAPADAPAGEPPSGSLRPRPRWRRLRPEAAGDEPPAAPAH